MSNINEEMICDEMSQKIINTAEEIALRHGAQTLSVRDILKELNITNRVFYNRFHNIDEVLNLVYQNTVLKIRESLKDGFDPEKDFFEQVLDIVETTLISSYKAKMQLNYFVFQNDSLSESNYKWWTDEIKKIIVYARESGYIKDINEDIMSYAIWCFIRGFNADAVGRKLPMEEAAAKFRYGFGILLDGMKK